jgi:hypothetical protein
MILKDFVFTEYKIFQGKIRGNSESMVAISTCHGIRGVLFDGKKSFYIDQLRDGRYIMRRY